VKAVVIWNKSVFGFPTNLDGLESELGEPQSAWGERACCLCATGFFLTCGSFEYLLGRQI
jgi:hypothetical protein